MRVGLPRQQRALNDLKQLSDQSDFPPLGIPYAKKSIMLNGNGLGDSLDVSSIRDSWVSEQISMPKNKKVQPRPDLLNSKYKKTKVNIRKLPHSIDWSQSRELHVNQTASRHIRVNSTECGQLHMKNHSPRFAIKIRDEQQAWLAPNKNKFLSIGPSPLVLLGSRKECMSSHKSRSISTRQGFRSKKINILAYP